MKTLIIETKKAIDFYLGGSEKITGVVEVHLKPVSFASFGDSLETSFEYFGTTPDGLVRIASGIRKMDAATMTTFYNEVKSGIPANATYPEINLYLFSTVLTIEAVAKFIGINSTLKATDFRIKP